MTVPAELLLLCCLSGPALAETPADQRAEAPLPDQAMLEFLATFASEDGQWTDPETIEQLKLENTQAPEKAAEHEGTTPRHKPGARQP